MSFIVACVPVLESCSGHFLMWWTRLLRDCYSLHKAPVRETYIQIGSLLPNSRNEVISELLENNPAFTHVLWVDSDAVDMTGDHIMRLLGHNVPIVSALACSRKLPYQPACDWFADGLAPIYAELEKPSPGLVERAWVGMHFTLIKRQVFEAIGRSFYDVQCHEQKAVWYPMGLVPRLDWEEQAEQKVADVLTSTNGTWSADTIRDVISFGLNLMSGHVAGGEDVTFCQRAAQVGFKSYVDCGVVVGHFAERSIDIRDHLAVRRNQRN